MCCTYDEVPINYADFKSLFIEEIGSIYETIIKAKHVVFYDTCSLKKHAALDDSCKLQVTSFFSRNDSVIVVTRIILMELAATTRVIKEEYIDYIKSIVCAGVRVILLNEELIYDLMRKCYSSNDIINQYLTLAVRNGKSPVGTITDVLNGDSALYDEVLKGNHSTRSDIFQRFFSEVRKNKKNDDNLGEELIGICVSVLSFLPGIADGKLIVLTEDKGAAGKLDRMYKKNKPCYRGVRFEIISTPKMVQRIYRENVGITEQEMIEILSSGVEGNVVVMGTTPYDIEVDHHISKSASELARLINSPSEINIVF